MNNSDNHIGEGMQHLSFEKRATIVMIGLLGVGLLFLMLRNFFRSTEKFVEVPITKSVPEVLMSTSEIAAMLHG